MNVKVAAVAYQFQRLAQLDEFEIKIDHILSQRKDAELIVFPEYLAMELASLFAVTATNIREHLRQIQAYLPDYHRIFTSAAKKHMKYICAGSFPVEIAKNEFRNRSFLYAPNGELSFQDKIHMTRFEKEVWGISSGQEIRVFATELGKLAINICYDAEFSSMAEMQCHQGAQILLVPSCTDSMAGYQRVRIGCAARALENQCYVIQTSTIGEADWCESIDINVGAANVYCTPDRGFPETGVLAHSPENSAHILFCTLDLDALLRVRENGQVLNFKDSFSTASLRAQAVNLISL